MLPVLVFDNNLNYVAQIDDYEYFRWTRRWRKSHDWELQINRYKENSQYLKEDYFVVVERNGKFRAGMIEFKELQLNTGGKGSENWKISGRSLGGLFDQQLALHNVSSGNGYDEQNDAAEQVMRHYVNVNAINPMSLERTIPYLSLMPDLGRGTNVNYRARFQTLTELLEEISLRSGLGWETTFEIDQRRFLFEVLEGKDLSPGNLANNPPVIFSPEFGNIKEIGYRYSKVDSRNVCYVAGQGEAQNRVIQIVQDGAPVGLSRRETFVDARDLETNEQLIQRGQETLSELKSEISVEFQHLKGGPFTYLTDFDLGDIIHVEYPEIVSMDARIIEVTEEVTVEAGEIFTLGVGKEFPDLISVIKKQNRNYQTEVRR
jgi:Siphovirus ReqiPepy6 Gp37-like protein